MMQPKYPHKPTKRVSKAANGRALPLTSAAWRKLRRMVLSSEPLCRMCIAKGKTVPATDVDHRDNNPANNELINLRPLCHECHSLKTQRDVGHNVAMGCEVHGMPLDPSSPWNNEPIAVLMRSCRAAREKSPATEGAVPSVLPCFDANC